MTFDNYQKKARQTAVYPKLLHGSVYPTLGLAGESGEVAEKVKKLIRDDNGQISQWKRDEIEKELGDVLWYLSQVASEFDLKLDNIAKLNIEKLTSRSKRGKLKGSGDHR